MYLDPSDDMALVLLKTFEVLRVQQSSIRDLKDQYEKFVENLDSMNDKIFSGLLFIDLKDEIKKVRSRIEMLENEWNMAKSNYLDRLNLFTEDQTQQT